jgi:RNA polymerase sigma factor (sigma-70 family)
VARPDRPEGVRGGRKVATDGRDASKVWEDRRVLEGVRRRDPDALALFFDASFQYVYNLAFRLLRNRDTVEDVVQDVFLKIFRAVDRLDVDCNPKPWLTTITYNTCRDTFRRAGARPETAEDASIIGERTATPGTPEEELLQREREQLVEKALLGLDEESRAVVILRDFCDVAHEQIATITQSTHAAVRKRYSRALKRMAEIIRGLQR